MTLPHCAKCCFGAHIDTTEGSYAAALLGGVDNTSALLASAEQLARKEVVPGLTAFCDKCLCVHWLARRDTLGDSLVDFTRRLREARDLEAAVA